MGGRLKVVVVGCGNMGSSHAKAYHADPGFTLVGVVDRAPGPRMRWRRPWAALRSSTTTIARWLHAPGLRRDLHVSRHARAIDPARVRGRLSCVRGEAGGHHRRRGRTGRSRGDPVRTQARGRLHPAAPPLLVEVHRVGQSLGKPLVMRMNLNQQSAGTQWNTHRSLLQSMSPIVDCGVHYVDVMCLMTRSRPVRVSAIGARLADDIAAGMYNYGQLQVVFADGSVGGTKPGGADDERDRLLRQGRGRPQGMRQHRREEGG